MPKGQMACGGCQGTVSSGTDMGVPWYPRGTEFQAGRDQMLRTMNN